MTTPCLLRILLALLIISFNPTSFAQEADAKKETSSETDDTPKAESKTRSSKRKKSSKPAKEEEPQKGSVFDDEEEKPDEPPKEEAGEEFGSGRRKTTVKKLDESDLAADKDKARYVKTLRKQFKEKEAYYVLLTREQGYEADAAAEGGYKQYVKDNVEILSGQDEAVAFIVEYMSKYSKPWEKKTKSTGKKSKQDDANAAPPDPVRNWEPLEMFATSTEAESYREAREQAIEAEKKAFEELNKPRR